MSRQAVFVLALLLLTAGALLFRLPDLGNRPLHGDEAVHAFKFHELWKRGTYRYDPNEFHGPTLYYAALPVIRLLGRRDFSDLREADLRLTTVIVGAGLVVAVALLWDALGRCAALFAAALTALSPAFVFYSRYYIQETLFVFFTLAALGCGWRYTQRPTIGWAVATGLCAGLMIATKETVVLVLAAVAVAWLGVRTARFAGSRPGALGGSRNRKHLLCALIVAALTAFLFLSGFCTNLPGPVDYLRSYTPWLRRAHSTDLHRHPWHYYLSVLAWTHRMRGPVWSEGTIVGLAVVGAVAALWRRGRTQIDFRPDPVRFIALYTLTLTLLYTAIPYKTPWCALGFLHGMILLAGVGTATLLRRAQGWPLKTLVGLLLLAGMAHLGWLAYITSYVYYTDGRNPYVYAQTVPDIRELAGRVETLARAHPQHERMVIKVFSADAYYWPLPWYLRRYPNVGYWTTTLPPDVDAPVVIASPEFDEELTRRLDSTHLMTGYFGLRPAVVLMVWVKMDLWENYLKTRKNIQEH